MSNHNLTETGAVVEFAGKTLLTTDEAARRLGLHTNTLRHQRSDGRGIPYVKVGRSVFYEERVIDGIVAERTR